MRFGRTESPLRIRTTTLVLALVLAPAVVAAASPEAEILDRLPNAPGIAVLLDPQPAETAIALAGRRPWTIYCQLPTDAEVAAARRRVDQAGLLGTRIYVEKGPWSRIHLADNLADAVIVTRRAAPAASIDRKELLRVVNPLGKVLLGDQQIAKPFPAGVDDWTHPYHGPDNNPQSRDQLARGPYLTQFFAGPYFMPPPSVSVAAGGRIFKAHGHLAFHAREWPWRNKLVAMNAFNGTILWTRPLAEGFNVHRNTLAATPTTVYLGDAGSCKRINAVTGALEGEIVAPAGASGPVWKWMALEGDVLYALVGEKEFFDPGHKKADSPPGWPWGGMSAGYDLAEYPWGFGRTFLAVDLKTGRILWTHHESERIDSRGVSMTAGRIYYYSEQKFLACLDAARGRPVWRTSDAALLAAIGPTGRAQHYNSGMSTFGYMTSGAKAIYFLGPHRLRIVAASTDDGRLLWQYPHGNFRPVLRDEGLYVIAPIEGKEDSLLLDPMTGKTLARLNCRRVNCTRATGTADGIFFRAGHDFGTGLLRLADYRFRRLPLMRPPCHDGVITAFGLMHWGSWICDCNVSMVGNISLAPAGDFDFQSQAKDGDRLETHGPALAATDVPSERGLPPPEPGDWPAFRADARCSAATPVEIAAKASPAWTYTPPAPVEPAAPIAAHDTFFWSGADGVVRALCAGTGKLKWSAYTGGAIVFPPVAYRGRLYVGSGDGWVYCFDAESGRTCWRFRAAPAERKIPIYGRLGSTWPVAGGVLVDDGVVYAAAGVANYDGTHLYALDAQTGKLRWQNSTSGRLPGPESLSGVSVQGHLLLHAGKLYLAGGNAASPAVYDARDGRCLNAEREEGHTACARGQDLFLIQDRVQCFDRRLYGPNRYWPGRRFLGPLVLAQRGETTIRDLDGRVARVTPESVVGTPPKVVWRSDHLRHTYALALGANAVVAAGERAASDGRAESQFAVAAMAVGDGSVLWSHPLPAQPAWWGLAIDKPGRVFVSLVDGRVLSFSSDAAVAGIRAGDRGPSAQAVHRAGQTFLTWPEVEGANEYRVYRAAKPIDDLAQATCVGSVDDDSTLNFRAAAGDILEEQRKKDAKKPPRRPPATKRDLALDDELPAARKDLAYHFVIEPGGRPLADDVGLFVYTAKTNETAHYAVAAGGKIVATSGLVSERVAMPEPVPQGDGHTYVHWVDNVGTPLYPAMGNRASYAFNFDFVASRDSGPRPLMVLPHARGGTYRFGHRNRRPGPPHALLPDDDPWAPGDVKGGASPYFTMWHGYNTNCGTGGPLSEGVNVDYTDRRLMWTIAWARRRHQVDPARITMTGGSMGGIASVFAAVRHPDLLASVFAHVPVLDFGAIWANNGLYVAPLWGKSGEKIRSSDGVDVYDTMRAAWHAERRPEVDFPLIVILVGKNDTTVGWADKPPFFRAMEATRHGGAFFWDGRAHGPQTKDQRYWYQGRTPPSDMAGLAEKGPIEIDFLAIRRDQSYPAFSRCSLNDDPGDGRPESGAPHGQINGYLLWDTADIVDTPTRWEVTLRLTPNAPQDHCTVDVTPRRLQSFRVAKGDRVRWAVGDGSSGEVAADRWSLITIPSVRVSKSGTRLRVEK